MKFNILKRAFSLTELLIVLVIVAVLFAAMLPIFTKRGRGQTSTDEPVWMFVKDDQNKSAYYDPGSSAYTSTAFIGYDPSGGGDVKPYSKVVLKAKTNQNMIQFRTGNDGNGTLAGVFTFTPQNMVLGSRMDGDASNNFNTLVQRGSFHTILGTNAASKIGEGQTGSLSTAVGASSSMGGKNDSVLSSVVSVGANSNIYAKSLKSVLVGNNVGRTETAQSIVNTVAIGANSLGLPASSGTRNVLLGYNVGSAGIGYNAMNNVILNSDYFGSKPYGSTIVGYQTYVGGFSDAHNITAIGYNACASFNEGVTTKGSKGSTTCIGYNSAGGYGKLDATKKLGWESDEFDHIFLGGVPSGFGGRAVMEIHNIVPNHYPTLNAFPKNVGPTVVLNSHLVVRGNVYIPDSNSGQVSAVAQFGNSFKDKFGKKEQGRDVCTRGCFWVGRKKYRKNECKILEVIGSIVVALGSLAAIIATGGAAAGPTLGVILTLLAETAGAIWGAYGLVKALDQGSGYKRSTYDPTTLSAFMFLYHPIQGNIRPCSTGYYNQAYPNAAYCPNVLRTSDIRLKDNISENHDALAKILQVHPYYYTYKDDAAKKTQVGVMAQDLEKYFITAVSADLNGYKNIRLDDMFFATINSVKSLDDSVDKLNSEIVIMESDISNITKDHKSINDRIKNIDARIKKLENK